MPQLGRPSDHLFLPISSNQKKKKKKNRLLCLSLYAFPSYSAIIYKKNGAHYHNQLLSLSIILKNPNPYYRSLSCFKSFEIPPIPTKQPSSLSPICFLQSQQTWKSNNWKTLISTALAAAVISFSSSPPALADLNKFEAELRGEFGIGSAAQFGSADLNYVGAAHVNDNFRRANFTAADVRESNLSGSTFNGAYLEKAVAYKANFTGADLSETLMDRMVLNETSLTNTVLVRTVLTCGDLGGAIIEGADFSDAVLDLPQKQDVHRLMQEASIYVGI